MSKKILVCCKLPHGIIIENPLDGNDKVTLNGKNKSIIVGAEYATTEVDAGFWENWLAVNKEFPAIVSGAIFTAKTTADAEAMSAEFKERDTGFERMRTDGKDKRAGGVKSADKE